jgi:alkylation response protein AidB-like acyl-CoA dehydrogenase
VKIELTAQDRETRDACRSFVNAEIAPHANRFDREERLPRELLGRVASEGYLGFTLPEEYGGGGRGMCAFGLVCEEVGRGCSSVRSLLTVHGMVGHALQRWGSRRQKQHWLPRLASGSTLAAFALTEPNVGSDAQGVEATATQADDSFLLSGRKKWITFGQIADLFLVFARCEGQPTAFLVERESPGLTVEPIHGMLGVRASMLAALHLNDCRIPAENLVGRIGLGHSHVSSAALDFGRFSVSAGCVGIARASLEASVRYAGERRQFGAYLKDHQLIQELIADMVTGVEAARLLCLQAASLKDARRPESYMQTFIAKYFASTTATKAANSAVQIHGANGCSSDYDVQRYLRDARVMEIIEGSNQIQQMAIARYGCQEA